MKHAFTMIITLALIAANLQAAPTLDEIIQNHIEALGGREALDSVQSIKMLMTFSTQGIEGPAVVYTRRPNKFRLEATIQGMTMIQAYDGETAWAVYPFGGNSDPQPMSEEQTRNLAEEADIDGPLVDYRKKGHSVELVGEEDMQGTPVYKLKVTLKSGNVRYFYLDTEYFLPLKITAKMKEGETEYEMDTFQSDFKVVEGLMIPHSMEIKIGPRSVRQLTIEKVEINPELNDTLFVMPESEDGQSAGNETGRD